MAALDVTLRRPGPTRSESKRIGRLDVLVNNAGINTLAHRVHFDQFPQASGIALSPST